MWDSVIKWTAFAANVVTIIALFVAVFLAIIPLWMDRKRRAHDLLEQRKGLLWALYADMEGLRAAIDVEYKGHQKIFTEIQGDLRNSYAWASLSSPIADAALRETFLLALTGDEMRDLASLRNKIDQVNAFVRTKQGFLTSLAVSPDELTGQNASVIDSMVMERLDTLLKQAEDILNWTNKKLAPSIWR